MTLAILVAIFLAYLLLQALARITQSRVLTPFMGVGSEVYSAVRQGRKGIGIELKKAYYDQARLNVASALTDKEVIQPAFEFDEAEGE